MKIFMIKIIMVISSSISLVKTPMSMGILLLTQTMASTLILAKVMTSSWVSMIMFMMFVGSLLVLFLYMSSIASNEKFKSTIKVMLLLMIIMFPVEEMMSEFQMMETMTNFKTKEMMSTIKMYNEKTMMITLTMFMYMLLTMIVVNFIIKIFKGPLRSK